MTSDQSVDREFELAEPSHVRVLLVEDNPADARLIQELLRDSGGGAIQVELVNRLESGCRRLESTADISLVLLDLSLPDSHGIETFQTLHRRAPRVPVIVLSGLANESVAVQAVHEGAQDYLVKGVGDGNLLVRAIRYAIERSNAALQLSTYAEELRRKNTQMEADIAMARELQLTFLPQQFPVFPPGVEPARSALQFCHRYLPAAEVGGDFFSVFPVNDHAAGLFICDVMGHGLRAALLTAVLRGVMEELRPSAGDPARFLAEVNRSFHSILRRTDETILATGFYLVADAANGMIHYACAGHPSPLLIDRAEGTVNLLRDREGPQGPALGLFEAATYLGASRSWRPGDFVFLFTDGVYEAEGEEGGEEFGLARLQELVRSRLRLPAPELLEAVLGAVQGFTGGRPFDDDVCLVGIEFAGPRPRV